jgi:ubiquitin carboxyl-terminal hydrolase L3
MHQSKVLDNACGIIACLHAVFNSPLIDVDPASVLGRFRSEGTTGTTTMSMSPWERCKALEGNTEFQSIHKAYASEGQSEAITSDQSKVKHHYIAYVLDKDSSKLVELDGTKAGPVIIDGGCGGDLLRGSIREVMGKLERGEISESLSMMTLNLSEE